MHIAIALKYENKKIQMKKTAYTNYNAPTIYIPIFNYQILFLFCYYMYFSILKNCMQHCLQKNENDN